MNNILSQIQFVFHFSSGIPSIKTDVILNQTGEKKFQVCYGTAKSRSTLTEAEAAQCIGEHLMHAAKAHELFTIPKK